jgi:hypothetical protein
VAPASVTWIGAEWRGYLQYYLLAQDVRRLNRLLWVMVTSMVKTLAGKGSAQQAPRQRPTGAISGFVRT